VVSPRFHLFWAVIAGVILLGVEPAAATESSPTGASHSFKTARTFQLPAGRASRIFTLHERRGVILVNRLTVRRGVRVTVYARIPHLAGASVTSWPLQKGRDASLFCRQKGADEICTQGEEWCPMPEATWHFHLTKLSGPAGAVRFHYVVAAPPSPE
jgi:hypothetical protein